MSQFIHISKFSTLNFEPQNLKSWEDQVFYCQKLHINDSILIQFAAEATETFSYRVENAIGTIVLSGSFTVTAIDLNINIFEKEIVGLEQDIYTFKIYQNTRKSLLVAESSMFCITENIENTSLLTYTNKVNDYDTIFINNTVRVFNFRFEGGFLDQDTKFLVESENFRNQFQEERQLFQMAYKTKVLTIGNAFGVPDWVAEKINLIFCCSNVYLDRVKHTRSEKSAPERSIIEENYPFSNFKIALESASQLYTTENQIFSNEWVAQKSSWNGYGAWINTGIFNR